MRCHGCSGTPCPRVRVIPCGCTAPPSDRASPLPLALRSDMLAWPFHSRLGESSNRLSARLSVAAPAERESHVGRWPLRILQAQPGGGAECMRQSCSLPSPCRLQQDIRGPVYQVMIAVSCTTHQRNPFSSQVFHRYQPLVLPSVSSSFLSFFSFLPFPFCIRTPSWAAPCPLLPMSRSRNGARKLAPSALSREPCMDTILLSRGIPSSPPPLASPLSHKSYSASVTKHGPT